MIILQIACVIGIIVLCVAGAIVMMFSIWLVLWLLERVYLLARKKGT